MTYYADNLKKSIITAGKRIEQMIYDEIEARNAAYREMIFRMAREAGWSGIYTKPLFSITMKEDDFLRFAALVAAAEREACAKVCEAEQFELTQDVAGKNGLQHFDAGCRSCAEMIRARGEK